MTHNAKIYHQTYKDNQICWIFLLLFQGCQSLNMQFIESTGMQCAFIRILAICQRLYQAERHLAKVNCQQSSTLPIPSRLLCHPNRSKINRYVIYLCVCMFAHACAVILSRSSYSVAYWKRPWYEQKLCTLACDKLKGRNALQERTHQCCRLWSYGESGSGGGAVG